MKGRRRDYLRHKDAARSLVLERIALYNVRGQFRFGRISIRNQKTRWGSCSRRGNLNFHYKLVLLPLPLVDYVIVHELCHLIEFNHSPAFWMLVEAMLPDHQARKRALAHHAVTLRRG